MRTLISLTLTVALVALSLALLATADRAAALPLGDVDAVPLGEVDAPAPGDLDVSAAGDIDAPSHGDPDSLPFAARPPASTCGVTVTHVAMPEEVSLGEAVTVTVGARPHCPTSYSTVRIALVVDGTNALDRRDFRDMKEAVKELVAGIMARDGTTGCCGSVNRYEMAIVAYDRVGRMLCDLTSSGARLQQCVNRISQRPGDGIARGIEKGQSLLARARRTLPPDEPASEVLIVVSGVDPADAPCRDLSNASRAAKAAGIVVIAVCAAPDGCDSGCLRQAATSSRFYFDLKDRAGLLRPFGGIVCQCIDVALKHLAFTETLPAHLTYAPDSAEPGGRFDAGPPARIGWENGFVPKAGVTFTYRVQPQERGEWPLGLAPSGWFSDNRNRRGVIQGESVTRTIRVR